MHDAPLVTILIPNYKTYSLTKLCLDLIHQFTDLSLANIIVIDNDSQDESLTYLRSLSWITLIERKAIAGESPPESHARALDLALDQVTTPYVLSIHTDTLVKRSDWLNFLLSNIQDQPKVAGVGSWKLEEKPWWRNVLKAIERHAQLFYYRVRGKNNHLIEGVGNNDYYLRSHCALYRTDYLRQLNLHFADGDSVAGKEIHRKLIANHYDMIFLPSYELIPYVDHINHATMILNPNLSSREKSVVKGKQRIEKNINKIKALLESKQ